MSGICGIYHLDNSSIHIAQLAGMVDRIAHRGPDDAGLWQSGSVGLGHRLLYNTPESKHEKLPRVHKSDRWVITADARIDNRDELIERLGLSTYWTEQITDSELILEAYIEWGEAVCDRLLGDFTFAIWDDLSQHLFLARDHFGVKPLYYYCAPHTFAFATELKALLYLPEIPQQLNPTKVTDYLTGRFKDTAITFYEDIFKLPAAHQLRVTPQGVKKQRYWQLQPKQELHFKSDEAYAEALKEQFEQAVQCRLRSAYPVGSMLRKELNSASIACVARDLLTRDSKAPLKTFSTVFGTITQCDEQKYIQAGIEPKGIDPHVIKGDDISPLTDLAKMLWHQDEAFYTPNLFLHWGLYKKAQTQNVRTLLDSFNSDTALSHGLPYVTELAQNRRSLRSESQYLAQGVIPFILEVADKAAAAHSIEPRFPFLDKRLVEFFNNTLPLQKQAHAGKCHLNTFFHHGLRHLDKSAIHRTLTEDAHLIKPYVNIALLQQTYQRFITAKTMSESDVLSIWRPLTLALWLKQVAPGHIEQPLRAHPPGQIKAYLG